MHEALEAYCGQRRNGSATRLSDFDAYQFIKRQLHVELAELRKNPRANRGRLAAGFSLDRCVADFYRIASHLPDTQRLQPRNEPATRGKRMYPIRYAEEHTVLTDDPPLLGRLDQVRDGVLVDFKTGRPDAERIKKHEQQLWFYSVLWWLRYEQAPAGLELRYANGATYAVTALAETELAEAAGRIRAEIAEAGKALANPPPPARIDVSTCRACPVRQLCDEYWSDSRTLPLRFVSMTTDSQHSDFCDVRVISLPAEWEIGSHLLGQAGTEEFGLVHISVPMPKCPDTDQLSISEVRMLGAAVKHQGNDVSIKSIATSEIFWLLRGGSFLRNSIC